MDNDFLRENMYNPYDLILLVIDGLEMHGRPLAFDSDVVDQKQMKNAFGKYVKPTKAATTCPKCGQGFTIELHLDDPPFLPYKCSCPICASKIVKLDDPFINPIDNKKLSITDLDPIVSNITKIIKSDTTVASRYNDTIKLDTNANHNTNIINSTNSNNKGTLQKKSKKCKKPTEAIGDFIEYKQIDRLSPADGISQGESDND